MRPDVTPTTSVAGPEPRGFVAGLPALGAALVVALVLGGCGGAGGGHGASAAASGAADGGGRAALAAAVMALAAGAYAYVMKIDNGTVTGVVDPAGQRQAKLESTASGVRFTIEGIVLGGGERYFRTSIPAAGVSAKKWYRFDRTKVVKPGIVGLFETSDPTSSEELAARVGNATVDGAGTIRGTYDLTRGGDLAVADRAALAALGERAKAAPFSATRDPQGRLASVRITVPAHGNVAERALTVDYSQQGKVVGPRAAEIATATPAVYNLLNN